MWNFLPCDNFISTVGLVHFFTNSSNGEFPVSEIKLRKSEVKTSWNEVKPSWDKVESNKSTIKSPSIDAHESHEETTLERVK